MIKTNLGRYSIYFLFFANLAAIGVFWWSGSNDLIASGMRADMAIALGRLAGLLAEFFILVELVLISRAPFVERFFGFDKLNVWHREVGYYLALSIFSHPLLLVVGYAGSSGVSLVAQLASFLSKWEDVMMAFIGFLIIIIAGTLSVSIFRNKMRYESWHFTHLFMYVAVGLALNHQFNTGDMSSGTALHYWYALNFIIFGAVIAYRFLEPLLLYYRHRFRIEKVIHETDNVVSIYIGGKNMSGFNFEPGQYLNIFILAKGFWWPHPFSISNVPDGRHIRISMKNIGDATVGAKDLKIGTKVIIDGPLGRFTEKAAKRNEYLLIAGGIGITPIRSLAESLSGKGKNTVLLYSNRNVKDIVFADELDILKNKNAGLRIANIISGETAVDGSKYDSGHIDMEKIKKYAPDFFEREIYICGPYGMLNSVLSALKSSGVPRRQLHYERFYY